MDCPMRQLSVQFLNRVGPIHNNFIAVAFGLAKTLGLIRTHLEAEALRTQLCCPVFIVENINTS